jgi:LuxR family transcriptional regulator, maltose regulon positive regulatory protein
MAFATHTDLKKLSVAGAMNRDEEPGQRPLIHEKIVVPDGPPGVSRLRLRKILVENLTAYNATIINGRAGSGKTRLAADFARHAGRAVSWYKVDAADSDLRVFCEYLLASMRKERPAIDGGLLRLAAAVNGDTATMMADALIFQLSENQPEPLLIVIEDLHLVYDADWVVPFFRRLLPLLPADLHLLITCRSMPPAPLWRLRSKQMLRVLDETELAFTFDEAVDLFKLHGLGEEYARLALRRTNGRAATLTSFATTPGYAGRALADSFLEMRRGRYGALGNQALDFQT